MIGRTVSKRPNSGSTNCLGIWCIQRSRIEYTVVRLTGPAREASRGDSPLPNGHEVCEAAKRSMSPPDGPDRPDGEANAHQRETRME